MVFMKLFLKLVLITCFVPLMLAACSTGGSGTPGNGNVSMKITFSDTQGKIVGKIGEKTVSRLPLSSLKLTVTPSTPSNYTPAQMELISAYNSGTQTIDIPSLTDNETYSFKVMAYDNSGNLVYLGETSAVVLPAGSVVAVNCLTYTGSSATLLSEGKALLASRDLVTAKDKLMMSTHSSLINDEAKLYYSLARVMSMYDNVGSSSNSQMDSIKKILDSSGISYFSLKTLANSTTPQKITLPKQLPATTPRAGDVRNYVRYYLLPEIDGAISNLSEIKSGFSTTFSPVAYKLQGNDIVIDYADVMVLRTLLYQAKASVAMATAYNFDFNIVDNINKSIPDLNFYKKQTHGDLFDIATLLQNNKNIGTIGEATLLTVAKTAYDTFVSNYESAFNLIKARGGQSQYLFVLDVALPNKRTLNLKTQNVNNGLNSALQVQKALNGRTTWAYPVVPATGSQASIMSPSFVFSFATRPDTNNTVNLSKFFNSAQPVNLRTAFVNCTSRTLFDLTQDRTLGGIYPSGYTVSPIYNTSPGWVGRHHGGWDIDSFILTTSKADIVTGLCN